MNYMYGKEIAESMYDAKSVYNYTDMKETVALSRVEWLIKSWRASAITLKMENRYNMGSVYEGNARALELAINADG
jgi:hypothetical protein